MNARKGRLAAVAGLIILEVFVLLMFAGRKKGYFIDEIYSFGLSNGYYKPFVTSYDVFDRWITGEEFHDYMTVQPGERFAYGSVYYNQTQDVHPPLYYMLLHTVCSFTPERFGVWQGVFLNLFFYAGCLCLIYGTVRLLTGRGGWAAAAMLLWGLSPGGISTGIYIRMYMLMTFLTMSSVYVQVKMLLEGQTPGRLAALAAATFLGLLTQYYFVFFAFFFSGFYVLWKLAERKWKQAAVYAAVMFGAVGAMVFCFPACVTQLTRPDSFVAEETGRNLTSLAALSTNVAAFLSNLNMDFFGGRIRGTVLLGTAAVCAGLVCGLCRRFHGRRPAAETGPGRTALNRAAVTVCGLTAACGLALLSVLIVAVVPASRYLYDLYPIMAVLAVCWAGRLSEWSLGRGRAALAVQGLLLLYMAFLYFGGYSRGCVQYLYPENEERVRLAAENSECCCLYVTNYENAPLTQDLIELSGYRGGVYIMPEEGIVDLGTILAGRDTRRLVVYVDTNAFWSSGYDPGRVLEEIKKETGHEGYRFLYENELSQAFLLE